MYMIHASCNSLSGDVHELTMYPGTRYRIALGISGRRRNNDYVGFATLHPASRALLRAATCTLESDSPPQPQHIASVSIPKLRADADAALLASVQ